jgi:hypothetical protein
METIMKESERQKIYYSAFVKAIINQKFITLQSGKCPFTPKQMFFAAVYAEWENSTDLTQVYIHHWLPLDMFTELKTITDLSTFNDISLACFGEPKVKKPKEILRQIKNIVFGSGSSSERMEEIKQVLTPPGA